MRRVVVDMQNALFADAIATALRNFDSDFEVYQSESPAKTTDMCAFTEANILIMEVTAYTSWKLEGRMKIRNEVKAQSPSCKIVLVVDENTEKTGGQGVSGEEGRADRQFHLRLRFFHVSFGDHRCSVGRTAGMGGRNGFRVLTDPLEAAI